MSNSNQEEPCFLDYQDAPQYFDPQPERPAGPPWWGGWWPTYGINSLDDLKRWVEDELEEMSRSRRVTCWRNSV